MPLAVEAFRSQMKVQMKTEALEKLNRQANQMSLETDTTTAH